jgi:hypothetical protein
MWRHWRRPCGLQLQIHPFLYALEAMLLFSVNPVQLCPLLYVGIGLRATAV